MSGGPEAPADRRERELKAAGAGDSHMYRDLKRKLKLANKTMGKQGETIHSLRTEIAWLRAAKKALQSKLDEPGEYPGEWPKLISKSYVTEADIREEAEAARAAEAPALTGEVGQKFEKIPPSKIAGLA